MDFDIFVRNVTDKVGTSSNLCLCTTWQNGKNAKITFSLSWCMGLCSSRRPLTERDETYLPSQETLSIVKRDMNVNGGMVEFQ